MEDTHHTVLALPELSELFLMGNAVEKEDGYKMKMLQNESVEVLDGAKITEAFRHAVRAIARHDEMKKIVSLTTQAYMKRIELEKQKNERAIARLKQRQDELNSEFEVYKSQVEHELDDCMQALHALQADNKKFNASYLTTNAGMRQWKDSLEQEMKLRELHKREIEAEEVKLERQLAEDESHGVDFLVKLRQISYQKPNVWRTMKAEELRRRDVEERHGAARTSRDREWESARWQQKQQDSRQAVWQAEEYNEEVKNTFMRLYYMRLAYYLRMFAAGCRAA